VNDPGGLDVLTSALTICLIVAAGPGEQRSTERSTPEQKAVAFLVREVPRWSRENHCFSCHNNGDAARALYQAGRAGYSVPDEALAETTRWLSRPESWDHNGGDGPFSDKRLARMVFATTLTTAIRTGRIADRSALMSAAERLALDQAADGSWPLEGEDATGSPAAYGRSLATFLARGSLFAANPERFRAAINRADHWLLNRDVSNVAEASVSLLTCAVVQSPKSAERRRQSLDLLRRAQSDDGGWGPYVKSPPESFDTALVLLGLSECNEPSQVRGLLTRGRSFLIAQQQDDGSWLETTRPSGNVSYAQRISTTGWAVLALLATGSPSTPPAFDPKR
jgi:Squalene-hopene cyclase C-terminal domain